MEMNNEGPYLHEASPHQMASKCAAIVRPLFDVTLKAGAAYPVEKFKSGEMAIVAGGSFIFLEGIAIPERGDNPQNSQRSDNNTPDGSNPQQTQVGGNHYTDMAIQPLTFAMANNLDACQTKIVKYTCRKKGNRLEDLEKARHVLDWYIDWIKQNEI